MFFFAFDLQEYLDNRGLTIDYKNVVPGLVSNKITDIIKAIEDGKYDINRVVEFRKKYVTNIENCTKKIIEFVLELL